MEQGLILGVVSPVIIKGVVSALNNAKFGYLIIIVVCSYEAH